MTQTLNRLKESPSQTAGPYVHIGCNPNFVNNANGFKQDLGAAMVNEKTIGERIKIGGKIFDGSGTPLHDAMVEIWQADYAGLYPALNETRGEADVNFTGWGRVACDFDTAEYSFETIRPGQVTYKNGKLQAPHISFWIVARGINIGLHTRMYFPENAKENSVDPVLGRIEHKNRIPSLIATKSTDSAYQFDIHLQGDNETVFFDI